MSDSCPRCGFVLRPIDDDPPPFCAQCGLPQLRVSDEAVSQPQIPGNAAAHAAEMANGQGDPQIDWPMALKLVGVGALVGVVPPMCLPGQLTDGTVTGVALLLTPGLTVVMVSWYYRSRPRRPISSTVGVRIGAALGLAMGCLIALATGISGFVLRYSYHSHAIDDKIQQETTQMAAQWAAAGTATPELAGFLQSPEFRAGAFILSHVIALLMLMAVAAVCGWLAGALLRARRQRHAG